ncbi:unnamed protein product [Acanthoscelides obtectus]|uniref:Uncharacterized protein n=1 Tax=Acanthoscelides obtectus TaxID=200917 RepID=A0A9P0QB41_ACAOB|nr:unnamed protein product [Acanthoscelides obtectus]CAH2016351.1 unnamed protein product [Acanthoscelides obtectus]CAK1657822.1 hypothetical protein AOBTE_LOCUS20554 [Acanthoscelides obtectus]CAK1657848.1 hypothetical protein AOBTE_LOCUS20568 [Acanthoscelides obtectus]
MMSNICNPILFLPLFQGISSMTHCLVYESSIVGS